MATPALSDEMCLKTLEIQARLGNQVHGAAEAGVSRSTFQSRLVEARRRFGELSIPVASMSHSSDEYQTILCIPDTQVKPGVPLEHLTWIGKYAAKLNADVTVCLGDFADMPSLSSYDRGKKSFEGRRYKADIEAVHLGMEMLMTPLLESEYAGRKVMLLGNHENRITRAVEDDAKLDGTIGVEDLGYEAWGWEVIPYRQLIEIAGIAFCHYFYVQNTSRAYGGMCSTKLKNIGLSFVMGHQQGIDIAMRELANGKKQHGLVAGSCLTPDHKVLTADLQYIPLGEVVVGDKLVSFDEHIIKDGPRGRRYRTGEVQAIRRSEAEVFAVTLSNGKVVKATADHRWLVKCGVMYQWRTTWSLRTGTRIPAVLPEWEELTDWGAGYLSGIYDGEGCFYSRKTSGGYAGQLTLSQKPGAVLEKAQDLLQKLVGVGNITHTNSRGVVSLRIKGGTRNIAKVLGQLRPVRLLSKFVPELLGQMTTTDAKNPTVVSIEPLGVREIIEIDIDAQTMIVEGMPHHNCYLHQEEYRGPQANGHYQGIVVLRNVRDGSYDLELVSLDSLRRQYGEQ